jgi:hypothetical protein
MEPPKCRLCGEKHWGACPSFTGKAPSIKQAKQIARIERSRPKDEIIVELEAEIKQLKRRLAECQSQLTVNNLANNSANKTGIVSARPANSRSEYMREYMRRRRAAKQAEK